MNKNKQQKNNADDAGIIELYWQRNEEAISLTSEKYGSFLFSSAFNILQDRLDCEECVNDTYLKIWNSIPPARPRSFIAFIAELVRNTALDMYRKRMSQKRVPTELTVSMEELGDALGEHLADISDDDLGLAIRSFVRSLPERDKFIFVGRYYFARSVSDIAKELGVSDSAVYKELTSLRDRMRSYLENEGVYL